MELKQNFSEGLLDFREFYLKEDEYDVPIYTKFRDGDEFIFSMKSFDKWIKINAVYELIDEDTNIVFSTKVEMRVVGYYPNSHFFNLIQKFVITVWNEHIAKNSEGEYYILKHIDFVKRKIVKHVRNESKNASDGINSDGEQLNEVDKDSFPGK